jgi:imidazolonepropionase-like amidohydrolase
MRKLISVAALAALGLSVSASAEDIAITGAKAFTNGGSGEVENATVLISDGKIVSVTPSGAVPGGYRVIDASGKWVTAGFMAGDTNLGLMEVPSSASLNDQSADKEKKGMGLNVAYALNPASTIIPITRIEGITRAMTRMSATADMWLGQGAVIKLTDEDVIAHEKAFLALDMDEGSARKNGGSRAALWGSVAAKLEDAMSKRGGNASTREEGKSDAKPKRPSEDEAAIKAVINGELPLYVLVHRKADILQLIALKKRFDIKVILGGGAEAWMVADELAAVDIPVVLNPAQNLPSDFDTLAQTSAGAGRLHAAGVKVAFIPPGTHNTRLVVQNAGIAVSMGMPWAAAMDALTINPAEIFGVADNYGTLTAGKDADVVVWDGDPLELMSSPDAVLIGGDQIDLVSRQTKLRDRYQDITRAPALKR